MENQLQAFLERHQVFDRDKSYLLAVSGGVDSVVMAYLFHQLGLNFGMAHVNYQLRSEDSNLDEALVKDLAKEWKLPFFVRQVDTHTGSKQAGDSIQLFARQFRYEWLNQVAEEKHYDYIATAHHAEDSLETSLLNLSRGSGIAGLAGIPMQRDKIIRPLLFTHKSAIYAYAKEHNLRYREDASNQSLKYDRNKIRHQILPVMESLNPSIGETLSYSFQHLRDALALYSEYVSKITKDLLQKTKEGFQLNIEELLNQTAPQTVLFEMLSEFGFNRSQTEQLYQSLTQTQSGQWFFAKEWKVLRDREKLLLVKHQSNKPTSYRIHHSDNYVLLPDGHLHLEEKEEAPLVFRSDPKVAWVDAKKLKYPLILRRWKAGDSFHPIGMDGHSKKLQDYFSDKKLSQLDKEAVWILESNGHIVWIVGHRMDENFKIAPETYAFLQLTYIPH